MKLGAAKSTREGANRSWALGTDGHLSEWGARLTAQATRPSLGWLSLVLKEPGTG